MTPGKPNRIESNRIVAAKGRSTRQAINFLTISRYVSTDLPVGFNNVKCFYAGSSSLNSLANELKNERPSAEQHTNTSFQFVQGSEFTERHDSWPSNFADSDMIMCRRADGADHGDFHRSEIAPRIHLSRWKFTITRHVTFDSALAKARLSHLRDDTGIADAESG
jgi:hypothetical protein